MESTRDHEEGHEEGQYYEEVRASMAIREEQYFQIQDYLFQLTKTCFKQRNSYFQPDTTDLESYRKSIEGYRKDFREMIGYPPPHGEAELEVRQVFVTEDNLCRIYRLYIQVAEGLECYGIYMVPKQAGGSGWIGGSSGRVGSNGNSGDGGNGGEGVSNGSLGSSGSSGNGGRMPLVINFHGGRGAPEMICNFEKPFNYRDSSRKFIKQGFAVFAPLLTMKCAADKGEDRLPGHARNEVRTLLEIRAISAGTSLFAIELLKLKRALDALLSRSDIDSACVGAAGLSFGGMTAIALAALDERIRFCVCSGGVYSADRYMTNPDVELGGFSWNAKYMTKFSCAEMMAMICPRLCLIEAGDEDPGIPLESCRDEVERAQAYYEKLGVGEKFKFFPFSGGHVARLEESMQYFLSDISRI
jgi:dienelactone hydrolase